MDKNHQRIISLEGVAFSFPRRKPVFEALDFHLHEGEKAGLTGENGSGKTTLLHIIIGILRISSGNITIFDRPIANQTDFYFVRERVGLLFQHSDDQLFCPTVLEDVAFGPLNLGKSPDEARAIARETLEELNLNGFEDRVTHQLSGGEKKLVALATILSMKPDVLLLDEPTSGLDESTKERLSEILNRLDISCLIASHEYDFLIKTTDTIYGLKNGAVRCYGESSSFHSHFHSHPAGDVPHKHNS